MKIHWYRKGQGRPEGPAEVEESNAQATARDARYRSWLEQVMDEHQRMGGFDHLEGKGQPLAGLQDGDHFSGTMQRILKDAGAKPKWIALQHEVYAALKQAVRNRELGMEHHTDWEDIQRKVRAYNAACPHARFQKPMVTPDALDNHLERWMPSHEPTD